MKSKCKYCKKDFIKNRRKKFFCSFPCSVIFRNKSLKQRNILKARKEEKSSSWLGEDAGYFAKHNWIRRYYGSAKECERCHTDKKKRFEWANISGKYYRIREDFISLCVDCHRSFDLGIKVNQYNLDGILIKTFLSAAEAARSVGVEKQSMAKALSSKRNFCKGFIWKKFNSLNMA